MIHFKDTKNKSALSTRWAQMTKQEQIIEKKKMEIQAKLEAQKQAAALAAQAKLANICNKDEKNSANIFSNDGSFMSQFKALLEKQAKEKKEKEELEQKKKEEEDRIAKEAKKKAEASLEKEERQEREPSHEQDEHSSLERSRERHHRWSDRGRNHTHSPMTPVLEDRIKFENKSIPSLMQIPVRPPGDNQDDDSESSIHKPWQNFQPSGSNEDSNDQDDDSQELGPRVAQLGPGPMGPGPWGPGPNMGMMPNMGPGPNMGMLPNMGPGMGPGPNMPPGGNMGLGPNMPPLPNMGPNMGPGRNMGPGPMMRPGGPNMPPMPPNGPPGGPMPPFMGGPPNFPMPPSFMGPNGPCGPMPPNMLGPNMRGPGPNGPMPPFCGPFPNGPFMGPNGPPNSMMPNSNNPNMPFMGPRPPFGPNGPNFGPNGPPNMPFMPPNSMHMANNMPEQKPLDNIPPPEPMKLQNIPPPMPLPLNHIPKPKDLDPGNIPAPPKSSQVLSPDLFPASVHRAASEVAANGDHWENVLKAIHSQDQNMWFLHNPKSGEYKAFRELVNKFRADCQPEVKPEDKYEPEFCLDDDSNDSRPAVKEESRESNTDSNSQPMWQFGQHSSIKREASSQSDEEPEVKRERRKKRKSRWGDDPPAADIKPPGVMAPLPAMPPMPGIPGIPGLPLPGMLANPENDSVKLTTVNRNNAALMQYAMTNYGTTNLNAEDWKKCEDNFKLNLLYQDMMKKRQEVERLAAMGKHKYDYDSDEDTSEGTWEHRLRAKEMFATEKWATELTKQAAGKHHIGDFLPPEELKKFMEKYMAAKGGKEPDLSDYKEFKLKEDNVGFKMLQKLGWTEGQGLGAEGSGIVDPINKNNQPVAGMGLGAAVSDVVSPDDDEFDAYRKRMMLAYRFRPNPLNNPRRPYY